MTANDCVVCSGPLHDTWVGAALVVLSFVYGTALFMACLHLYIDHDAPLRGLLWRALPVPFAWLVIAARASVIPVLPPPRRPKLTRGEMERRIAELERELGVEDASALTGNQ